MMDDNDKSLKTMQDDFMDCLLGKPHEFAQWVQPGGSIDVTTRINIYTNAYQARFVETIETDHPMLGLYLGDELFDKMTRGYIRSNPSHFTSLRQYADALPAFLADNHPFSSHPIISELASFERFLLTSFDAQDAKPIGFSKLTELEPQKWPAVQCRFHPSLQIFHSGWNSVDIWRALKQEKTPQPAQPRDNVNWLIWRNGERLTQFRCIDKIELVMLQRFLQGDDFSQVCEILTNYIPEDQVPVRAVAVLKRWFENQLIINF